MFLVSIRPARYVRLAARRMASSRARVLHVATFWRQSMRMALFRAAYAPMLGVMRATSGACAPDLNAAARSIKHNLPSVCFLCRSHAQLYAGCARVRSSRHGARRVDYHALLLCAGAAQGDARCPCACRFWRCRPSLGGKGHESSRNRTWHSRRGFQARPAALLRGFAPI